MEPRIDAPCPQVQSQRQLLGQVFGVSFLAYLLNMDAKVAAIFLGGAKDGHEQQSLLNELAAFVPHRDLTPEGRESDFS